jgi:hypothetical protein
MIKAVKREKDSVFVLTDKNETLWLTEEEFQMLYTKERRLICSRKNPKDRVESWECLGLDGVFSWQKYDQLLISRCSEKELELL